MITTMYKCDRCGAALGEDGEAITKTSFSKVVKISYRIKLFKDWNFETPEPTVCDLCCECRESLDRWLKNENA